MEELWKNLKLPAYFQKDCDLDWLQSVEFERWKSLFETRRDVFLG